jgi:hypothetical protein
LEEKAMRRWWRQITSWIVAAFGFYLVSALSVKIILPYISLQVFGYSFPQKDGIGRLVQGILIGMIVMACYIFINNTSIGHKISTWFLDSNKNIFKKNEDI